MSTAAPEALIGRPIVVGIDESDSAARALATAIGLARSLGSELVIVAAYAPLLASELRTSRLLSPPDVAWQVSPDAEARVLLDDARDQAVAAGVSADCVARLGPAASAIVAVALERRAGLLVIGNHEGRGRRRLRAAVTDDVWRQAPCSVLIVDTAARAAA